MASAGFEILQFSLCEGWINNLFDRDDRPYVFDTIEEAIVELQDEFDQWHAEMEAGERNLDEGYDISEFCIRCKSTGVTYDIGLVNGKVIVILSSHTNN